MFVTTLTISTYSYRNSNRNEGYRRADETTKQNIKHLNNEEKLKPKAVFHKTVEDQGHIESTLGCISTKKQSARKKLYTKFQTLTT
jgi:hypothetical protein